MSNKAAVVVSLCSELIENLCNNDELTAAQWALNSAVECHPHTVEVIGSNPIAPTISSIGQLDSRSACDRNRTPRVGSGIKCIATRTALHRHPQLWPCTCVRLLLELQLVRHLKIRAAGRRSPLS